jgi:hypothetical protein
VSGFFSLPGTARIRTTEPSGLWPPKARRVALLNVIFIQRQGRIPPVKNFLSCGRGESLHPNQLDCTVASGMPKADPIALYCLLLLS